MDFLAFLIQDGVTGYTVPVDDPQELADRLSMLLRDSGLRRRLGEQALQVARQYAWDKIAARIIELYEQVISGSNLAEISGPPT